MTNVVILGGRCPTLAFLGAAVARNAQSTTRSLGQLNLKAPDFEPPPIFIPKNSGKQNEPFYRAIHNQKHRRK